MSVIAYEKRLTTDLPWAMLEADRYFGPGAQIFRTLLRLATVLDSLSLPHAAHGAAALFAHGCHGITPDLELIVPPHSLPQLQRHLPRFDYSPSTIDPARFHDNQTGVPIDFLLAGSLPRDVDSGPVRLPHPAECDFYQAGIRFVPLPKLLELELASHAIDRPRLLIHLSNVVDLIQANDIPLALADAIHPSVRQSFLNLWTTLQLEADTIAPDASTQAGISG